LGFSLCESCGLCVLIVVAVAASPVVGQTRGTTRKAPAPPAAAPKTIVPDMNCRQPLGVGVTTKRFFCTILAARDPADGLIVAVPAHKGPATLTFDLHNLHTYSEELVRAKRAYTKYTATIGVMTMDNTLITRAVVQNEFRTASDLIDRVGGGAGPGGVKAVAPTGSESIVVMINESDDRVSLLGEKVSVENRENTATYSQAGRPIAVVSNMQLEYRPAPPPKPKAAPKGRGRSGG